MAEANVAELIIKVLDDASAPMKAMSKTLAGVMGDVKKAGMDFESFARRATAGYESAKRGLEKTAIAAAGFAAAMYKPIASAIEMQESLEDLRMGTKNTEADMENLRKRFFDLSKGVTFSAGEIAAAANKLPLSMRESHDSMVNTMDVMTKFAMATRQDLGQAVTAVGPLISNLGVRSEDLGKAVDMMTQSWKASRIPIDQISEGMGKLAEEMASIGVKGLAGVRAITETMTAVQLQTSDTNRTMTIMQKLIPQLFKPSIWQKAGIDMAGAMDRAKRQGINPLVAGIRELQKYLSQFQSDTQKQQALEHMGFGAKTLADVNAMIQSINKFGEAHQKIMEAAGATEKAYQDRVASWTFVYKKVVIALSDLGNAIGKILGEGFRPLVAYIIQGVKALQKFIEEHGKLIKILGQVAAAVITLSLAINSLRLLWWASGLVILRGVVPAIAALLGTSATGLLGVVGAVTAIVAIWKNWNDVMSSTKGFLKDYFSWLFFGRETPRPFVGIEKQSFAGGAGGLLHRIGYGGGGGGAAGEYPKAVLWRLDRIIELLRFTQRVMGAGFSGIPGWKYQGGMGDTGGGGGSAAGGAPSGSGGLTPVSLGGGSSRGRAEGTGTTGSTGGTGGEGTGSSGTGGIPKVAVTPKIPGISGGGGGPARAAPAALVSQLRSQGYNDIAIAGILGNIKQESNFDPRVYTRGGDAGSAHGMFQWRNDRFTALLSFAKSHGLNPNDPATQISFMHAERGHRLQAELNAAGSPARAAYIFGKKFEQPKVVEASRGAYANQFYKGLPNMKSAKSATSGLHESMNSSFKPHVDDEHLDDAIRKAQKFKSIMRSTEKGSIMRQGAHIDGDDSSRHFMDQRFQSSHIAGS